jgi:DNA (cytosine-5)-methyltransferase 1
MPQVAPNGYKAIDTLCGAGGMTLAQHLAGFQVSAALNHWQLALDSQAVHFPGTPHFCANVRTQFADELGLADYFHMSPDCRDHSRAKGGRPVDPSVRGLAEEAPRYLIACNAKVATFENVPEFVEWGPLMELLDADGKVQYGFDKETGTMQPLLVKDKTRNGEYYKHWVDTLRAMGYVSHEWRILNSADYGSPQARRRYFGMFSRAGIKITWPQKTHDEHGRGGLPKWRGAIKILEPGNYGESVFTRRRPYVDATLNRLAEGVERYGADAAPWMLKYVSNPPTGKPNPGYSAFRPLHTLMCQRTPLVVRPVLLRPYYVNAKCTSTSRPMGTVVTREKHLAVAGVRPLLLCPYYKSGKATAATRPLQTLPTKARFLVASAAMPAPGFTFAHQFGNGPRTVGSPLRTLLASRRHQYLGFFHYYSGGGQLSSLGKSLPAILSQGKARLMTARYAPSQPAPGFTFINQFVNPGRPAVRPLSTMLASKRPHNICFFHYLGSQGNQVSSLLRPTLTLTSNPQARLLSGIYQVGQPGEKVMDKPGDSLAMLRLKAACRKAGMVDLLARMLTVRESLRGQGFPDWYTLLGTETDQRKMIGNAVEVNTGLAVASEVRRMLDRHAASGRALPPLKLRPVLRWEQTELFAKEVTV